VGETITAEHAVSRCAILRPNQLGAVAVVGLNRTTRVTAAQFKHSAIAYSSPAMVGTSMDRILAVLSI